MQAAAGLRLEKYQGDITLFGEEAHLPYQRPPLSKQYLKGEVRLDNILVKPRKFFADNNIRLELQKLVEKIEPTVKTVTTRSGDIYPYDKLLLATGSRLRELRLPGYELSGIHYLRTVDDVDSIRASMAQSRTMCIVGGGYVGLEVAAVAVTLGMDVTIIETEARILKRVTTAEMSSYYHRLHTKRGVNIIVGTSVLDFEGDAQVETVISDKGRHAADIVIVGVGAIPNTEIAEAAGIECDNGILVDEIAGLRSMIFMLRATVPITQARS